MLLLAGIKFGFKLLIVKLQPDDDDLVPSLQSSVDIFDALYTAKCMQSARTLMVGFGIIVVDLAQNCIALYLLAEQTKSLRTVSARIASSSSQHQPANQSRENAIAE